MINPRVLEPKPSGLLTFVGGLVGTVLLISLLHLLPVIGPALDYPRLIGGLFTADAVTAYWVGLVLFFLSGVFLWAPLVGLVWSRLPGPDTGWIGAGIKGALWGTVLWFLSGLLLPLLGMLSRVPELQHPGVFGLGLGWMGAAALWVVHLLFGMAVALIGDTARGIEPLDTIGWPGYGYGAGRDFGFENDRRKARGLLGEPLIITPGREDA